MRVRCGEHSLLFCLGTLTIGNADINWKTTCCTSADLLRCGDIGALGARCQRVLRIFAGLTPVRAIDGAERRAVHASWLKVLPEVRSDTISLDCQIRVQIFDSKRDIS